MVLKMSNVEDLIQRVIQQTNLSRADIIKMIEEKKKELLFVNDIAAIHILAKDLGVPLKKPELKKAPSLTIKKLKSMDAGLTGINITGVVFRVYNPFEFQREGNKGIFTPIMLHDGTDRIKVLLWGNMSRYITDKRVERGTIITIKQAYTRMGRNGQLEVHLGDRGLLEIDTEIDNSKFPDPEDEIVELDKLDNEMEEIDTRGIVVKIGTRRVFNRKDNTQGSVTNVTLKGKAKLIRMAFWDSRSETPFDFLRGDKVLIQGARVSINRDGNPELHATRTTSITKEGHEVLPEIEEKRIIQEDLSYQTPVIKKIKELSDRDELVTLVSRKGPVEEEKEFKRADGTQGTLKRALIFDETGIIPLVIWGDKIVSFDSLDDGPIEIKGLKVIISRYQNLEVHTTNFTEFNQLDTSTIGDEPPLIDIQDLTSQFNLVAVQGVVLEISEIREFNRTDGSTGKVASMTIQDTSDELRIVAWDENVEKLENIREKDLKYVKIFFGRVREQNEGIELHLTHLSHIRSSSRIPVSLRNIELGNQGDKDSEIKKSVIGEFNYIKKQLSELSESEDGTLIEVIGKMVRVFQTTPYYYSCGECWKKAENKSDGWYCPQHGKTETQLRMRLTGILDDGTGTIRVTFFGISAEIITGMSNKSLKVLLEKGSSEDQIFEAVQKEVEGKTVLIQGRVQIQTQEYLGETMNQQELFVNRINIPDPKVLTNELLMELQKT